MGGLVEQRQRRGIYALVAGLSLVVGDAHRVSRSSCLAHSEMERELLSTRWDVSRTQLARVLDKAGVELKDDLGRYRM